MNLIFTYATSQQIKETKRKDNGDIDKRNDGLETVNVDGKNEHNDNEGTTKKRKRVNLTKEQIEVLEDAFKSNEYLNQDTKMDLSQKLGMEQHKVVKWFDNRRSKKRNFQLKQGTQSPPASSTNHQQLDLQQQAQLLQQVQQSAAYMATVVAEGVNSHNGINHNNTTHTVESPEMTLQQLQHAHLPQDHL